MRDRDGGSDTCAITSSPIQGYIREYWCFNAFSSCWRAHQSQCHLSVQQYTSQYYQPNGGAFSSDMVSGGETETHLLDGLQRGVTYNISIVALSLHLPSPMVGPVTVMDFGVLFNLSFISYQCTISCLYTSYKYIPTS